MKYPYVISSDQHCHAWSAFAKVSENGYNSRLDMILQEISRSYAILDGLGGDTMFLAGDLFHQRGEIKPSVFNPTHTTFENAANSYPHISTFAIPGNHDLEGNEASSLGNAMQALSAIETFNAYVEPTLVGDVLVFPWYADLNKLRQAMRDRADPSKDALIHAPVNGVIKGIPNHGLEADELASMGYRRVFAGHYHDHRVMEGGKVVSIGATTHQTWSDPGTKAGFLIVYEDRIEHIPTAAPLFVDLDLSRIEDEHHLADLVAGNYARVKLTDVTDKEINLWRADLTKAGALGSIVLATKRTTATARTGAAAKSAVSLAASVEHFVRNDLKPLLADDVSKEAQSILSEVTA